MRETNVTVDLRSECHVLARVPDHVALLRAAEVQVRLAVREGLVSAAGVLVERADALTDFVELALDEVCRRLAAKDVAWSLAYLAGVQMAPELLRQTAAPADSAAPDPKGPENP